MFRSEEENGNYLNKDTLNIPMTGVDIRDPCVSANEDYLIFASSDSTLDTASDLYVSFKDEQGQWTPAQKLGHCINTNAWEIAPYISPDQKYLFFSRRDRWQNASYSNIFWVSLQVIEALRP